MVAVLTHIEVAEKYHNRANLEKNDNLYTDVIYRTNHAFEGILKEAYNILEEKRQTKLSPYEIEEFFSKKEVLKDRVMDLFSNYRKNWRNPSTHDYELFFSQQEAYLAIVNVSAFVSILLDQITEKLSYIVKKKEFVKRANKVKQEENFESLHAIEKVQAVLNEYANYYMENFDENSQKPGIQRNAELAAFLLSFDETVAVATEVKFESEGKVFRPDLLVDLGSDKIIVETKGPIGRGSHFFEGSAISQLNKYLLVSKLKNGIVFFYPGHKEDTIVTSYTTGSDINENMNIREIFSDDPALYEPPPYFEEDHI